MRYVLAVIAGVAWILSSQNAATSLGQETTSLPSSSKVSAEPASRSSALAPFGLDAPTARSWSAEAFAAVQAMPAKELTSKCGALMNLAGIGCGRPALGFLAKFPVLQGMSILPLWLAGDHAEPAAAVAADAPQADDLTAAFEAAKGKYQPISGEQLAAAQAKLAERLGTMETWLAGDKKAEVGWKEFLLWDRMQAELAKGKDAKTDTLHDALKRYGSGQAGLELDQFRQVRAALDHYIGLLTEAGAPDAQAQYKKRLDDLASALKRYQTTGATADADTIGMLLGQLYAGGQADGLNQAIHGRFMQPNLMIRASKDFIAAISNEQVDENNEVHDSILGTQVTGHAHVVGTRTAVLVDDDQHGAMDILVNATASSQTVGNHSPVTIYAHGETELHGVKRVLIDADGYTDRPATSHASTHTTIDGLCIDGGRLVQRIATKKVYQGKAEAEFVASQHAEQRLNEQINSNSTEGLAKQNANFQAKFRGPLQRRGAFPELLRYASTTAALTITAREGDAQHLAAPTPPPALTSDWFLAARIHESFINNLTAASLSDRTINKEEFDRASLDLLGDIPKEVQAAPDQEERDWTITFAKDHPVTVTFADSGFAITIRGTSYTSEPSNKKVGAMNVTARYKIDKGANGFVANRIGDVEVLPPDFVEGSQLSSKQTAERRLLHNRFVRIFKPSIPFEGVTFATEPWSKAGRLVSSQLSADHGWLTIGWVPDTATAKK